MMEPVIYRHTWVFLGLLLLAQGWVGPLAAQVPAEDEAPSAGAAPTAGADTGTTTEASPAPGEKPVKLLIPTDPIQLFLAGGFLMWPILFASIIFVWFALERLIILRRRRVIPRAFVDRFLLHLEQGRLDQDSALELCEQNHSPVAQVFAHGVRKWGKPSVEVEQAIIDGGERQVSALRNNLRVINGVSTVSPLLGLFGTVVGMIMCFNELAGNAAGGGGKAELLAHGIGVALLTTAAGLTVAIPSLIMYMYLSGRVDSLVTEMDSLSQRVVHLISGETLMARQRQAARAAASGSAEGGTIVSPAKTKQAVPSKQS